MKLASFCAAGLLVTIAAGWRGAPAADEAPVFELVAPDLFSAPGGQPNAWADFDNDGDLDLFTAFRERPNRLLRNDDERWTEATEASGLGDPRKTVGGVWWDFDQDGDLDLFVANQEGDANGFFRNDGGRFVGVAPELGSTLPPGPKTKAASARAWRISTAMGISISSSPTTGRTRSTATNPAGGSRAKPSRSAGRRARTPPPRTGATSTTTADPTFTSGPRSTASPTTPISSTATGVRDPTAGSDSPTCSPRWFARTTPLMECNGWTGTATAVSISRSPATVRTTDIFSSVIAFRSNARASIARHRCPGRERPANAWRFRNPALLRRHPEDSRSAAHGYRKRLLLAKRHPRPLRPAGRGPGWTSR
jgi:hypothetical protein